MKKLTLTLLFISTIWFFPVADLRADEPVAAVAETEEITVYATRTAQPSFDVPAMVSKELTDTPGGALSGDFADLLEFTPGVEAAGGPRRGSQTVSIRGFGDEAIITLVDGRRQNFGSGHDGRVFVDPSLLRSVEIVKGPSSAVYGGGGLGGVAAFETKDAADLLAPGQSFGAISSFSYRSASSLWSPTFSAFAREGGWDFLGSVSYLNSGDIRQGDGSKLETKDEPLSLLFKAGSTFFDFHTLKFQGVMMSNEGRWPQVGISAVSGINPVVNQRVRDNQFSLKYGFGNPDNLWLNPSLHIYRNETQVLEEDIAGLYPGRVQTRTVETTGLTLDNQTELSVQSLRQIFSYGFEIYGDEQTGTRSHNPARDPVNNPDRTRDGVPSAEDLNYGFYLQDEMRLSSAIGDFIAIAAIRYDKYKNEDNGKSCSMTDGDGMENDVNCPSLNEGEFSPKFAVTYKPVEEVMIFGSWAKAFRAPNLTEIYASGQHFPGGFPVGFRPAINPVTMMPAINPVTRMPVLVPILAPDNMFVSNPNLKPETVSTFELGAGLKFDRPFGKSSIKGSWFYSKGDDFIDRRVDIPGGTTTNLNVANAKIWGFDIEGGYQFHPVRLKSGLSYVKAEDEDTGAYLFQNVPLTFVGDLGFVISGIDSVAGLRSRIAADNDRVGSGETPTDGYSVFDIYYRWTPDGGAFENLTLDLGIENVFDKSYTKRFQSLKEEGRSFVARVACRW